VNAHQSARTQFALLIICVALVDSGCASFRINRLSKPAPIPGFGRVVTSGDRGLHYLLRCSLPEVQLEIGALNAAPEKETWMIAPILLPFSWPTNNSERRPLIVEMRVKMMFDPARIFCVGTDQGQVAPVVAKTWTKPGRLDWTKKGYTLRYVGAAPVPLERLNELYLTYDVDANPSRRFSLLIEGLSIADQVLPVPLITFGPAKIHEVANP